MPVVEDALLTCLAIFGPAGVAVNDLLRPHGISRATFCKRRSKSGGRVSPT